jgi:GntR family transcriptional regulator/MocR family aminotransferase
MEDPGYIGATGSFRCAGLRLRSMPVDEDGLRLPSRSVGKGPRLIYCTPSSQMPLGVPLAYARREALVSFAENASSWILEDDYDGEYRYDTRPLPTLFGLSRSARVIYMGTFSKTMFPGLRIGYLVLPHALVEPIVAMKFVSSWQSATLEQQSLADFIESGEFARHVRRCRKLYSTRAEEIYVAGQRWLPPSHQLLRPRSGLSAILAAPDDEDHEHVIQSARASGIELSPISMFAVGKAVRPGYVLGFAAFDAGAIRKAMQRLGGILAVSRNDRAS